MVDYPIPFVQGLYYWLRCHVQGGNCPFPGTGLKAVQFHAAPDPRRLIRPPGANRPRKGR